MRCKRTGLWQFLNKDRVAACETEQCDSGTGPETPWHVLLHCPHEKECRIVFKEAQGGHLDFARLLNTPKGALSASKWMIRSGRIPQFQLAGQLLYEEGL